MAIVGDHDSYCYGSFWSWSLCDPRLKNNVIKTKVAFFLQKGPRNGLELGRCDYNLATLLALFLLIGSIAETAFQLYKFRHPLRPALPLVETVVIV